MSDRMMMRECVCGATYEAHDNEIHPSMRAKCDGFREAAVSSSADTVEAAAMTDEQAEYIATRMPVEGGGLAE